jgi:hypothetical protein
MNTDIEDNEAMTLGEAMTSTQFFVFLVGAGLGMIFVGVFILMPLGI